MALKSSPFVARETWSARWIWSRGVQLTGERNDYCYFRKTFDLTSAPRAAKVCLSADNRYQLFVNNVRVCRGPARCTPKHQSYDEIDLTPYLKVGKNCIAAVALHFGISTFQSIERSAYGFFLDGEVTCQRGKPVPLHTNRTWKTLLDESYKRDTARYTIQLGYQEDVDSSRAPDGWTRINYNDRHWTEPHEMAQVVSIPFEKPEPRGIPFMRETPETFAQVCGTFTGKCGPDYATTRNIGQLVADEKYIKSRTNPFESAENALTPSSKPMTVKAVPSGQFAALILDAGKESAGYLNLDVEAQGGEIIDFFYTEHLRPDGSPVRRARNGNLNAMADRYRCRKGKQSYQFFAWKGFRYIVAIFRDVKRPLHVRQIDYTHTGYPVERRGRFQCSDERLNKIWEVGAWTQQLCMHDAYMDCPWREQAQWWGDARIQWRVNMAVFGDHDLFRRGIRQIGQSQVHHGLTYGLYPSEAHVCILPDYTLVWICSIWDYYFYTGDAQPITEHFDRVVRALTWFEEHAGKSHLLKNAPTGMWLFLDWAPLYKAGYTATFTMQYLEALQIATKMAKLLGKTKETRKYQTQAALVERAINRAFWDSKKKQYYEGRSHETGKIYPQVSQHSQTYAILTGLQSKHQQSMADRIAWIDKNFDRLAKDNLGGNCQHPKAKHPIASPFFFAYTLEALFRAGYHTEAMSAIRKHWGRMLDDGATTWYESWTHSPDVHGDSSACHAWSASPTYHLSEQIGGVMPLTPGGQKVRIAPHAFDLDHAEVTTPLATGKVHVKWKRVTKHAIDLEIKLPKNVEAEVEPFGQPKYKLKPGHHKRRITLPST